jgi:hypothetical protein
LASFAWMQVLDVPHYFTVPSQSRKPQVAE